MGDSGGDEPVWKFVVSSPLQEYDDTVYDTAKDVGFAVETLAGYMMDDRDCEGNPEAIEVIIKKIRPSEIEEPY